MMREVNYLTDKSQDSEKLLSFKEQILRDLEEANEQLLKIEKEYDLPDRSIETPSSLKEEEEATLPPKERRGLVLIDPPYELKEDYDLVVKAIEEGYKRFATGTYAIWYPVVLRQQTKRIFKGLEATGIRKILKIELAVRPDSDQRGMTASGMVVINPPWTLETQMKEILPYLTKTLVPEGTGSWTVEWITPE